LAGFSPPIDVPNIHRQSSFSLPTLWFPVPIALMTPHHFPSQKISCTFFQLDYTSRVFFPFFSMMDMDTTRTNGGTRGGDDDDDVVAGGGSSGTASGAGFQDDEEENGFSFDDDDDEKETEGGFESGGDENEDLLYEI
jgi:hypothetical protein